MPPKKGAKTKAIKKNPPKKKNSKSLDDETPPSKKIKKDNSTDNVPRVKSKEEIIKELKSSKSSKKIHKVDQNCHLTNAKVVDDYDCILNQTNIQNNNNKFYVIQRLEYNGEYYVWTRWGRVGESGANAIVNLKKDKEKATNEFHKKFKDKTGNDWLKRDKFVPKSGKYILMELVDEDESSDAVLDDKKTSKASSGEGVKSKLELETQKLMKLIFDNDMFQDEMKNMNIDVKKMPLGKISKSQIAKGFEILDEIEMVLENKKKDNLADLSSRFYTLVPHNFGRQRPPIINDQQMLQQKIDLLTTLGDIEIAQALQTFSKTKDESLVHPIDANYSTLDCDLKLVDINSDIGQKLNTYFLNTTNSHMKILQIWSVNRHSEGARFSVNNTIDNRKLLWHGTKLAVVAAIFKGGLRIMPHSGGLVGKGIYFASENAKSAGYTSRTSDNVGIMFLNEVALGKEFSTFQTRSDLKKAPNGYDSVVARGSSEPDPKKDAIITLENKKVVVPQGKPVEQKLDAQTTFRHSEYLIYNEHQCRIRYVLTVKF